MAARTSHSAKRGKSRRRPLRVAFLVSECVPFAKTGGLADVAGTLPRVLSGLGCRVQVFLPRYRGMEPGKVVGRALSVPLGDGIHLADIQAGPKAGAVEFLFVDYPPYFDREGLYQQDGADYTDNPKRFGLFCRAVLEFFKQKGVPDIVHAHDWQTAMAPVLLKSSYMSDPQFAGVPTVLTVHNLGYQGIYPSSAVTEAGLPTELFSVDSLEYWGKTNFLKGGLLAADRLITVSPTYAREIQTAEYGFGLEGVVAARQDRLRGILNGVDYTEWSPEVDAHIAARYSAEDLSGKLRCKQDLLESAGWKGSDTSEPVVGIVSRLTVQKGFELLEQVAADLMKLRFKLVVLGVGEKPYQEFFLRLAREYPGRVAVKIGFDAAWAHKIEAGSDIFLMPSRYEPCGLNQIYSLRYGTVPVVRATGGLEDTVERYDPATGGGTGFKFREYTGAALLEALRAALEVYGRQPDRWRTLQLEGMARDFSWERSASRYVELYRELDESRSPR